jgi:hypothetical protein
MHESLSILPSSIIQLQKENTIDGVVLLKRRLYGRKFLVSENILYFFFRQPHTQPFS